MFECLYFTLLKVSCTLKTLCTPNQATRGPNFIAYKIRVIQDIWILFSVFMIFACSQRKYKTVMFQLSVCYMWYSQEPCRIIYRCVLYLKCCICAVTRGLLYTTFTACETRFQHISKTVHVLFRYIYVCPCYLWKRQCCIFNQLVVTKGNNCPVLGVAFCS